MNNERDLHQGDWALVGLINHAMVGMPFLKSLFLLAQVVDQANCSTLLPFATQYLMQCKKEGRTDRYIYDTLGEAILKAFPPDAN